MTIFYDIDRDGKDIECQCRFENYHGSHGARDSYGQQMEPDEEPYCEFIDAINLETKEEVELLEWEIEAATEKANRILSEQNED